MESLGGLDNQDRNDSCVDLTDVMWQKEKKLERCGTVRSSFTATFSEAAMQLKCFKCKCKEHCGVASAAATTQNKLHGMSLLTSGIVSVDTHIRTMSWTTTRYQKILGTLRGTVPFWRTSQRMFHVEGRGNYWVVGYELLYPSYPFSYPS